jgi:hypothetical protein
VSNFSTHYDELASLPFIEGYVANDHAQTLLDELFFQRAVQTYFFPGNAPSRQTRSTFSIRVPHSSLTPIPPVPAWR